MTLKSSMLMFVAAVGLAAPIAIRAQQGAPPPADAPAAPAAKPVTALTSPVTGNAVTGKKLYYDHACYSCHGFNGETGARTFVPNWPANLATERSFIAFLRGRANVSPVQPSTSMPNYPVESMSDAQARDVYAYIRSFKSASPPVGKIPVMSQILAAAKKPYKP
jgi:mono/diheme cytochrome c family protein